MITSAAVTVRSLVATNGMFADTIGTGSNDAAFGDGIAGFQYAWSYAGGLAAGSGFSTITNTPLIGIKPF